MTRRPLGSALLGAVLVAGCAEQRQTVTVASAPPRSDFNAVAVARAQHWLAVATCPVGWHCGVVMRVERHRSAWNWKAVVLRPDGSFYVLNGMDCNDEPTDLNLLLDPGDLMRWTGNDATICDKPGEWRLLAKRPVSHD